MNETLDPGEIGLRDAISSGWYKNETGELLEGFRIDSSDTVLDLGCGVGLATMFCANRGAHVVFTDVVQSKIDALLDKAKKSKARKVEGIVSDSLPLPLSDNYASKVIAMEVIEHTEDPESVMAELARVGRPGAKYLITVPAESSEMLQKPFADPGYFAPPNHIQIFDKDRFCKLVIDSGLIIERYTCWGFYWTMWMSIFWCVGNKGNESDETLGLLSPPYDPAILSWTKAWQAILNNPECKPLVKAFNEALPKAQAIIAYKPNDKI